MKIVYLLLVTGIVFSLKPEALNQSEKESIVTLCTKSKPYQDVLVNNEILYHSSNSCYCQKRYDTIKQIVGTYSGNPPYTLLDLGAAQGYFTFKLSEDFPLKYAMLAENGQSASQAQPEEAIALLHTLCELNKSINTTLFTKPLNVDTLRELRNYGTFDIVLALSLVHHFKEWHHFVDALTQLGKLIIIEIPSTEGDISDLANNDQLPALHDYIVRNGGIQAAEVSRFHKNQWSKFYIIQPKPC